MENEFFNLLERIDVSLEKIASSIHLPETQKYISQSKTTSISLPPCKSLSYQKQLFSNTERIEIIKDFLSKRNITIDEYNIAEIDDLAKISFFIGERFDNLSDFFNILKKSINEGCIRKILDLYYVNEQKLSDICQIATRLYNVGYLSEKIYMKAPKRQLIIQPDKSPHIKVFFLGKWLELYLINKVIDTIGNLSKKHEHPIKYSYLNNIKVTFHGGRKAEFDILFEIEGKLFWFEAKTHNLDGNSAREDFDKYNEYRSQMGIDKNHAYVIYTNPDNYYIQTFKNDYLDLSILNLKEIQKSLPIIIEKYALEC